MKQSERLHYLEGMRGIAATIVVLNHLALSFFPFLMSSQQLEELKNASFIPYLFGLTPFNLFLSGHFAVQLFFVHSGFILSYSFFKKRRDQLVLESAAARRYFRLTGPMAASILFAYSLHALGCMKNGPVSQVLQSPWLSMFYQYTPSFIEAVKQAVYTTYTNFDLQLSYNSVLWTIRAELLGSFLVFAFLGLFGKVRMRWFFYLVLFSWSRRADFFPVLLGMGLCDVYVNGNLNRYFGRLAKYSNLLAFGLLLVGFYLGSFINSSVKGYTHFAVLKETLWPFINIAGAFCVVASLLFFSKAQWFLSLKPVQFLGRVSYSVYLLHVPLICSFTCWLFQWLNQQGFAFGVNATICWMATVSLNFVLSHFFAEWVDQPSIRLAKSLYRSLFQKNEETTSSISFLQKKVA